MNLFVKARTRGKDGAARKDTWDDSKQGTTLSNRAGRPQKRMVPQGLDQGSLGMGRTLKRRWRSARWHKAGQKEKWLWKYGRVPNGVFLAIEGKGFVFRGGP